MSYRGCDDAFFVLVRRTTGGLAGVYYALSFELLLKMLEK